VINRSTLLLMSFSKGLSCVFLLKIFHITHNVMVMLRVFALLCSSKKR